MAWTTTALIGYDRAKLQKTRLKSERSRGGDASCLTSMPLVPLSDHKLTYNRLFVVALGRPRMISQRDISVAKPSLLQELEYVPWESYGPERKVIIPVSRSVSNMNYTCIFFQIASETLEEMWVASKENCNLSQTLMSLQVRTKQPSKPIRKRDHGSSSIRWSQSFLQSASGFPQNPRIV